MSLQLSFDSQNQMQRCKSSPPPLWQYTSPPVLSPFVAVQRLLRGGGHPGLPGGQGQGLLGEAWRHLEPRARALARRAGAWGCLEPRARALALHGAGGAGGGARDRAHHGAMGSASVEIPCAVCPVQCIPLCTMCSAMCISTLCIIYIHPVHHLLDHSSSHMHDELGGGTMISCWVAAGSVLTCSCSEHFTRVEVGSIVRMHMRRLAVR